MNANVIFGKQEFVPTLAKVTKIRKNTNTTIKVGGEVDKSVTFWIDLDNGQSIPAPLSAINRAVGRKFEEQNLIILHGGTISYYESQRTAGELFKWRPTDPDKSAVISTTDGVVHSIDNVEVPDSRFQYLMALPIYETSKVTNEIAKESDDDDQLDDDPIENNDDKPEGAVIDETQNGTATPNARKKGGANNPS